MTPAARTLKHYRDLGFIAASVEKWLPPRGTMEFGRRIDVFGFGDVLVAKLGWGVALVQCTSRSGGNYAAHKAKDSCYPRTPSLEAIGWTSAARRMGQARSQRKAEVVANPGRRVVAAVWPREEQR